MIDFLISSSFSKNLTYLRFSWTNKVFERRGGKGKEKMNEKEKEGEGLTTRKVLFENCIEYLSLA